MMQEDPAVGDGGVEVDADAEYARPGDAPFEVADGEDFICSPCVVVQDDEGEASQIHRPLPAPKPPSKEEVRKHNITHWPYRSWCPHCIMGRRNAEPRFQDKGANARSRPLVVLDYAFLRNTEDEEFATIRG